MAKTLVLGAEGRLGVAFSKLLGSRASYFSHREWDITSFSQSSQNFKKHSPKIVINCAAYVLVDEAEVEIEKAYSVNVLGPAFLAFLCNQEKALLVHFSTDYVFSGKKKRPYRESDPPEPLNVYGLSKWAGEAFVRKCAQHLLIRTSGLYGPSLCSGKKDFVLKVVEKTLRGEKVAVVADMFSSPTYALDCARATWNLVSKKARGLFHVVNQGKCSWYEFAQHVFAKLKIPASLQPISTQSLASLAPRPLYSVLTSERKELEALPHWRDALNRYLETPEFSQEIAGWKKK